MVPEAGVEPARYRYHWILSPARLPIPSFRRGVYCITRKKKKQQFFEIFIISLILLKKISCEGGFFRAIIIKILLWRFL